MAVPALAHAGGNVPIAAGAACGTNSRTVPFSDAPFGSMLYA